MTFLRLTSPTRALVATLAASVLLMLAADRAAAYEKPPGGAWTFNNLFDDTKSGSFALTRDGGRVAKLVLVPGEDSVASCGSAAIKLTARPKLLSYRSVNGRYAVARLRRGLFVPFAMGFKQGGRSFSAKLMLLWDHDGRLVDTGKVEFGDCRIGFYARKR